MAIVVDDDEGKGGKGVEDGEVNELANCKGKALWCDLTIRYIK